MNKPHTARLSSRAARLVLGATLGALLLAACGDNSSGSTTTTAKAATTTTAAGDSTTTTAASDADAVANAWAATAQDHEGDPPATFKYDCPAGGTPQTIWGVETYTDDSSVCTAGVHVGLVTTAKGGTVTIQIAAGQDAYDAGVANGVTSQSYGSWSRSFIFPDAPPGSGDFAASPATWDTTAADHRGQNGTTFTVDCAANGTLGSVWGSGPYTDDSSICTAAVQAGLITVAAGGKVTVEVAPGADSYQGSSANGVTSQDYAAFDGSFTFPADQPSG